MKFIASARRRAGACLGSRLILLDATALNVASRLPVKGDRIVT
jgi:hypothetical protein